MRSGSARNSICYCGSNLKFKNCCMTKEDVDLDLSAPVKDLFDAMRQGCILCGARPDYFMNVMADEMCQIVTVCENCSKDEQMHEKIGKKIYSQE